MRHCHLVILLSFASTSALAGSQSRDCTTADKAVVMGAGNSTNRAQIN